MAGYRYFAPAGLREFYLFKPATLWQATDIAPLWGFVDYYLFQSAISRRVTDISPLPGKWQASSIIGIDIHQI
jgi:hypothetical protein